jgi:hypothetical protein
VNCLWVLVGFRVGPRGVGAPSSGGFGRFAGISADDGLYVVNFAGNDMSGFMMADPFLSPSRRGVGPTPPDVLIKLHMPIGVFISHVRWRK